MAEPEKTSLTSLVLNFMHVGLTSVGGAAGPLRHVIVKKKRWLSETEFAELFGLAQALPGATAINLATMLSDRLAGPLGPAAALAGLILPSLAIALVLSQAATHFAAVSPRFAAGETAVTAAVGAIFISNGLRLMRLIWRDAPDVKLRWRAARITISALGVLLVAGFHVFVPFALVVLIAISVVVETRLRLKPSLAA